MKWMIEMKKMMMMMYKMTMMNKKKGITDGTKMEMG